MKTKFFVTGLAAVVFILGLRIATPAGPAPPAVMAGPEDLLADTPTPEPPTATPTWSGRYFLPFGGRGEAPATPTPTATLPPTATASPAPPLCVFPDPTTPGITVEEGDWKQAAGGEWIVHNSTANGRVLIRFDTVQLISLWSADNEQWFDGAEPARAMLDNGVQVVLPWTGDMEVVAVSDGPWETIAFTVLPATGDSPGIHWCIWQD